MEPLTMDPEITAPPGRPAVPSTATPLGTRGVNQALRALPDGAARPVTQPRGRHNLAVGLTAPVSHHRRRQRRLLPRRPLRHARTAPGPTSSSTASSGWSVGENLMGGTIRVRGSASQSAGASARGGRIFIEGDASLRAGISLKGATLAIAGDAGAMTGLHGPGRHHPHRRRRRARASATRSTRR